MSALILLVTLAATLQAQVVGSGVFGGGRKAAVGGNAEVTLEPGISTDGGVTTPVPVIYGSVYGGNDMANRVNGSTKVILHGCTIHGNVFGGGNGFYGCHNLDNCGLTYSTDFGRLDGVGLSVGDGFQVLTPVSWNTQVTVNGDYVTVDSAVYGGGHLAAVGVPPSCARPSNVAITSYSTTVSLTKGTIGSVFGGGRMAPVYGDIHLIFEEGNTVNVGDVFGGNDIATTEAAQYITTGNVLVKGAPTLGRVFGGSNGEYDYRENGEVWTFGTPAEGDPDDDDYIPAVAAKKVATLCNGMSEPILKSSSVTVQMSPVGAVTGSIAEVYGGSNAADVRETAAVTLTSGEVGVIYGGCNKSNLGYAAVGDDPTATVTINGGKANTVYGGNNISGTITGGATTTIAGGEIAENVFGGSNGAYGCNAEGRYTTGDYLGIDIPAIASTQVTLNNASAVVGGNIYGGGNMAPVGNSESFSANTIATVTLTHGTVEGAVYGGGRMAPIYGQSLVDFTDGPNDDDISDVTIGKVFGGNDIANVASVVANSNTVVTVKGRPTIGSVYGGGNGEYDYNNAAGGVWTLGTPAVGIEDQPGYIAAVDPIKVSDYYCDGMGKPSVNSSSVTINMNDDTDDTKGKIGIVYGGCSAADVVNAATVTMTQGTVATIYGGNDITGNVGSTTVNLNGGKIEPVTIAGNNYTSNVFGGSNGDYGCATAGDYSEGRYAGLSLPTVNSTKVVVEGTIVNETAVSCTIEGNVYGGGNKALVGSGADNRNGLAEVKLVSGNIQGDAFAGGRCASVYGFATIYTTPASQITINNVYGGNDISGNVTNSGSTLRPVCGTSGNKGFDGETTLTADNSASYVMIQGTPHITNVFGGGNGEYDYRTNGEVWTWGTNARKVAELCNINSNEEALAAKPTQTSSYVDVNMGEYSGSGASALAYIGTTYGGGNAASVGNAITYVTGKGRIETAYAGGNGADVKDLAKITTSFENVDVATGEDFNIKTIFGGNNAAEMNSRYLPEIDLVNGQFKNVYGGGNAGDMKTNGEKAGIANLSTFVHIHDGVTITDYLYGGCNQANVDQGVYVLVDGGKVANLFGGNDISGNIAGEARIDLKGGTVDYIYGGSNGKYDYENGNVYVFNSANHNSTTLVAEGKERPTVGSTQVNIIGGKLNNNLYGGGLAGTTGTTNVKVEGDAVIMGNLYGGGCGATEYIGYCESDKPHVGNVTGTANMTVKSFDGASSGTNKYVYGGGHAGDVHNTNLVLDDCEYHFQTVYGGCYASHVTGDCHTTIHTSELDTNKIYIDTVYGGNNFAGYVYNTILDIDGGAYKAIYGAGNGDYDYDTWNNNALAGLRCKDVVPYSQFITLNLDPLRVVGNVYGGGNMGVVGKDLSQDNKVDRITTFTTGSSPATVGLPGLPHSFCDNHGITTAEQLAALFPYGEYGSIVLNINSGIYGHHIFAGARGREYARIYGKKHLVFGFKEANMYGGYIRYSLYGGSESVDDGYPWECNNHIGETRRSTTMRPSTVLNLMGGTIHKHCYGGGYQGNVYGSVYVNAGINAVKDNMVWYTDYGNDTYHTRTLQSIPDEDGRGTVLLDSKEVEYEWDKKNNSNDCPWGGDSYYRYLPAIKKVKSLYFDASIYNGSDWGAAGAVAEFNTRGFYGGESLIYFDGAGYHTSLESTSEKPPMHITYSLFGSGTSTEGGDVRRRIFVRHYGDYTCPTTSKSFWSIQRADKVVIDSCYFELTGEQDAYMAYVTPNYSMSRIDTLTFRGDNVVEISGPARHIREMRSEDWIKDGSRIQAGSRNGYHSQCEGGRCYNVNSSIYVEYCDAAEVESLENVVDDEEIDCYDPMQFCDRFDQTARAGESNKIVMDNGIYMSLDYTENGQSYYGALKGYAYLGSEDGTCAYVYGRSIYQTDQIQSGSKDDGGFVGFCEAMNKRNENEIDEVEKHKQLEYIINNEAHYRTWQVGKIKGERNRHITIVANAEPTSAGCDNYKLPGYSGALTSDSCANCTQEQLNELNKNKNLAIAKASLELPPTEAGHFFKIENVLVDQDNGGQIELTDAAFCPSSLTTSNRMSDGTWKTIDLVAPATPETCIKATRDALNAKPDYTFGLIFDLPNAQFDTRRVGTTENLETYRDEQVLVGGESFTAINGYTSCPVSTQQSNVITSLDFYLTYNTDFKTTIIRDVIFDMMEYKWSDDGKLETVAPIRVTITISTVITKFSDMEVSMLAMYNEGMSNEYVRKIVLPATFEYRNLHLVGVDWEYDGDIHNREYYNETSNYQYQPPTVLGSEAKSDQCLFNMQPANILPTVNNQFGFTVRVSENISDNISNTLGWYDIATRNLDVYKECAEYSISTEEGTEGDTIWTLNGIVPKTYSSTNNGGYGESDLNKAFTNFYNADGVELTRKPMDITLGSLDGRASASIEGILHFNGNLVYPDNANVGRVILHLVYYKDGVSHPFKFTFNIKTREHADTIYVASALHGNHGARKTGGLTITKKSKSTGTEKTFHACKSTIEAAGNEDPGHHPDRFVISMTEAMKLYKEGDVICIFDTVDMLKDENFAIRGYDYNMVQVIRYSGAHSKAPGIDYAYTGPMFRMRKNSKFSVYNTWFNGSGVTRTWNTENEGLEKAVLYAEAPVFVLTENSKLTLGKRVLISNNFNQNKNDQTGIAYMGYSGKIASPSFALADEQDQEGNPEGKKFNGGNFPGGAIGIYESEVGEYFFGEKWNKTDKTGQSDWIKNENYKEPIEKSQKGYPMLVLGDDITIFDNMIAQQKEGKNQGAAIYTNGGTLQLGNSVNGGDLIRIHHNYLIDKNKMTTGEGAWFKNIDKVMTTFSYGGNCKATASPQNIPVYALDTTKYAYDIFARLVDDKLGEVKVASKANTKDDPSELSNIYLTRVASSEDGAVPYMDDAQSDMVSFISVLHPNTLIGITKDFPGETVRDTIRFAKVSVSRPATAEEVWNNFNFFDDKTKSFVFYHLTVDAYTIFFQRCASFKQRQESGYSIGSDLMVEGGIPMTFKINSDSKCSAILDTLEYRVQGGFYPYTYDWYCKALPDDKYKKNTISGSGKDYYYVEYDQDFTNDWTNIRSVRTAVSDGTNSISAINKDSEGGTDQNLELRSRASVDTCVTVALQMAPVSERMDVVYRAVANDLTFNCPLPQEVDIRVVRSSDNQYQVLGENARFLDIDQVTKNNPDYAGNIKAKIGVHSAEGNPKVATLAKTEKTNDSTRIRYLRITKGTHLLTDVQPGWEHGDINFRASYLQYPVFDLDVTGANSYIINGKSESESLADKYFCPGDVLTISTNNKLSNTPASEPKGVSSTDEILYNGEVLNVGDRVEGPGAVIIRDRDGNTTDIPLANRQALIVEKTDQDVNCVVYNYTNLSSFMMWDFDPQAPQHNVSFTMPDDEYYKVTAIYQPNTLHWYEVVNSFNAPTEDYPQDHVLYNYVKAGQGFVVGYNGNTPIYEVPSAGYRVDYDGNVTISNRAALAWLISTTNGLNGQQAREFHNKTITIDGNLDMSAYLWTPLGTMNNPFAGHFDGGYNTISGVICIEDTLPYVGFFGHVGCEHDPGSVNSQTGTASIKNTKLDHITLKGNNYVGGLAAIVNDNTIIENNTISNGSLVSGSYITGGITAEMNGNVVINQNSLENVNFLGNAVYVGAIAAVVNKPAESQPITTTICEEKGNNYSSIKIGDVEQDAGPIVGPKSLIVQVDGNESETVTLADGETATVTVNNGVKTLTICHTETISSAITNNDVNTDNVKMNGSHVEGLVAIVNATSAKQPGFFGRLFNRKSSDDPQVLIANNYVRFTTNGNAIVSGGLMGQASDAHLVNNYVYGRVNSENSAGALVGYVGNNVTLDRCYYRDGTSQNGAVGGGKRAKTRQGVRSFIGTGNQVVMEEKLGGVDNLTRALNQWALAQRVADSGAYLSWRSDLERENNGLPLFGDPDVITVYDSVVSQICDQFVWLGDTLSNSAVFSLHVVDSSRYLDSTLFFIYHVHHSERTSLFDSVAPGEGYEGYGFSYTAEELAEMVRHTPSSESDETHNPLVQPEHGLFRTIELVDSLLTENGCDSIVVLSLTLYTKVDIDDVEEPINPAEVAFDINVYPNPTRSLVNVETEDIVEVEIFDAVSRKVAHLKDLHGDHAVVDLAPYSSGIYYLRVRTTHGVAIKKVIKK